MARDTLSIMGLYNANPTIFDNLILPAEIEENKDTLINNLLMECAEFEILYPDPDFMKWAIFTWSNKNINIWNKLLDTTKFDYDPIANYDRHEKWTDRGNSKTTVTPKNTLTVSENSYENAGFVGATKTEAGGTDESETDNTIHRKGRAWGNIGVTTTQQMIAQERESVKFNIYDVIIDDFKQRFCIMIY